jgi:hypothetical protein
MSAAVAPGTLSNRWRERPFLCAWSRRHEPELPDGLPKGCSAGYDSLLLYFRRAAIESFADVAFLSS